MSANIYSGEVQRTRAGKHLERFTSEEELVFMCTSEFGFC